MALISTTPGAEPFVLRSNAGFVAHNPLIDDTWSPSLRGGIRLSLIHI